MFFRMVGACALMTLGLAGADNDAAAREYDYQIIKVAPHDGGTVVALNNKGMVLGNFGGSQGAAAGVFTWQAGKVTKYTRPSSRSFTAYGLNDHGDFVGSYRNARAIVRGFIYSERKYKTLSYPGYDGMTVATAINNMGTVVGNYICERDPDGYCGFSFSGNVFATIDLALPVAINQEGDVAGQLIYGYPIGTEYVGALLTAKGILYDVDGYGTPSFANGLNDNAAVVGVASGGLGSFEFQSKKATYFGSPNCMAFNTEFAGINDAGDIVGACTDGSSPFVYHHGVFENLKNVRGQTLQPIAINNHGQILAKTSGDFSVLATPK